MRTTGVAAVAALVCLVSGARAEAQTLRDEIVQPPSLAAPERGALAGDLGRTTLGPGDVSRGAFQLPSPWKVPSERGPLLAEVLPSYGSDAGLSEWGMGWRAELAITRSRLLGDIDYQNDELSSPWGRLVRGDDGAYYPLGLAQKVRVELTGTTLVATLPDGTREYYGRRTRVDRPQGVYAWYLDDVEDVLGRRTRVTYVKNLSGRPFVSEVAYGGRGDAFAYRVRLTYDLGVPFVFTDYRSGEALQLDRRVKSVSMQTRTGRGADGYEERWHYDLAYLSESWGRGTGTAFYLREVVRVMASGEQDPPLRYGYSLATDVLAAARFAPVPELDGIIQANGSDVVQPEHGALVDVDADGREDLERASDGLLYRRVDAGFVAEAAPALPAGGSRLCRPTVNAYNLPRVMARLEPGASAPSVVALDPSPFGTDTDLTICDRAGTVQGTQRLSGSWELGAQVRLVDVDHDRRPDLVNIDAGRYTVLPGRGTAGFGAKVQGYLDDWYAPNAVWVQDMNGDGVADLVTRDSDMVTVWYGRTHRVFGPEAHFMNLVTAAGPDLGDLDQYQFELVDANKDGLTDLLLTRGTDAYLFANTGESFVEHDVPALAELSPMASAPIVADLGASGNTSLLVTIGAQARALALDAPETGLLRRADDGKGTVLSFDYARGPAAAGIEQRPVVLARMGVTSGGHEDVRYSYVYSGARPHSLAGILLGFADVLRTAPRARQRSLTAYGDDVGSVPLGTVDEDDGAPGVERYTWNEYDDATFRGLPWKRLRVATSGWRPAGGAGPAGSVTQSTTYEQYAADFCPVRTRKVEPGSTLLVESTRASVPALSGALHCVGERTTTRGIHADASLDFVTGERAERNAAGQPTRLVTVDGAGTEVELQRVDYDGEQRVQRVTLPGKGTTVVDYDPVTRLPSQVTAPDGVITRVTGRDARTGALTGLEVVRGARSYHQQFRYDGFERLARRWDDLGGASEADPLEILSYREPTAERPGAVHAVALLDAIDGTHAESVAFTAADGAKIGSATRRAEGWVFDPLARPVDAAGQETTLHRAPLTAASDPLALGYASLYAGTDELSRTTLSSFGLRPEEITLVETGVRRRSNEQLALVAGSVVRTTTENGEHPEVRYEDADGQVTRLDDAEGATWSFTYDALGRLRRVDLPDGAHHTVGYDGHGRLARVDRSGLVSLVYAFVPGTQLVASVTTLNALGVARRRSEHTYDAIGRSIEDRDRDLATGAERRIRRYWDGATPEVPTGHDDPGLLSVVEGPGFRKRFRYRADGVLEARTTELGGWRSVTSELILRESGSVRSRVTTVRDGAGQVLHVEEVAALLDASGRDLGIDVDGRQVLRNAYAPDGQLAAVSWPGGDQQISSDPLTSVLRQVTTSTGALSVASTLARNARGLVDREQLFVGPTQVVRQYSYGARGALLSATDAQDSWSYDYDSTGLPVSASHGRVTRGIARAPGRWTAGDVVYELDDLGQVVAIGDLQLDYGPDGQLVAARRGESSCSFVSDEAGARLLRVDAHGRPELAYLAEGVLDATTLTEPVKVEGRLLGVLENGVFAPLAVDARGTVVADRDGTPRFASPYGERTVHPDRARAVDYVERSYDPDLGLVRMGVRDYDPSIGQFVTPDPLYLADPARCREQPLSCNLYAYAGNDPVNHVDPSGHEFKKIERLTAPLVLKQGSLLDEKYPVLNGELRVRALGGELSVEASGAVADPGVALGGSLYTFQAELSSLTLVGDEMAHVDVSGKILAAGGNASAGATLERGLYAEVELAVIKGTVGISGCGGPFCLNLELSAGLMAGAEFEASPRKVKGRLDAGLLGAALSVGINDKLDAYWDAMEEGRAFWNPTVDLPVGSGVRAPRLQLDEMPWSPPVFDSTPDYTGPYR